MDNINKKIIKVSLFIRCIIFILFGLSFFGNFAYAEEITAILYPQSSCPVGTSVVVSFGMSFPKAHVSDVQLIRVKDQFGSEIPSYVRTLLPWRDLSTGADFSSIRSALIQVNITFSDNTTPVNIIVETGVSRTQNLASEIPLKNNWVLVDDSKYPAAYGVYEPSVYVTLSPSWMGRCAIKSRTIPYDTYVDFAWYDDSLTNDDPNINDGQNFFKTMINDDARVDEANDIDYLNTEENEPYLFDRAMTMFTIYIRSGNMEVLREAHRAAYFYAKHIKDTGFFDLKPTDDLKYSYGECLLTDLMLIGDEDHIDKIEKFTLAADTFNYVFDPEADSGLWTERHFAFSWLTYIVAFETTGTISYADKARTRADYLFTHQDNPPSNSTHGQAPNDGALVHSYVVHEGFWNDQKPYWVFSPWMSVLVVDVMQRYYLHSGDSRVLTSAKRFGDAIINVGNSTKVYGDPLYTTRLPAYLCSSDGGPLTIYDREEQYDDYEHCLDVAKITAFAYYCSILEGIPQQKYLDETNALLDAAENVLDYWIRPTGPDYGKSIYRLVPARKGNWWFRTTADVDYLILGDSNCLGRVSDLSVVALSDTSTVLLWTAPGSDGNTGTADRYDLRFSVDYITDVNWENCSKINAVSVPQTAGAHEMLVIQNSVLYEKGIFPLNDYYFALKTYDSEGYVSRLSNVANISDDDSSVAGAVSQGGGCFIATAAFDSPMALEVQYLCKFRDEYLTTNPFGKKLVEIYYTYSPPFARYIETRAWVKSIVQRILRPIVFLVKL